MTHRTSAAFDSDFAQDAARWLQDNVPQRWREHRGALEEQEAVEIRRQWDRQLFDAGYSGLSLPKEFGGQGLGLSEEVAFSELAARAQAPDGLARIGRILTAPTLIVHGTEQQRQRFLPPILQGTETWCQGFSEPGAGSDLAGVRCRAEKVAGGYEISGRKIWTSFAAYADRCLLLACTDQNAPRHKNLSMFLLDMKQPGVTISPIKQISGGTHFAEVHFDRVFVSDDELVDEEGSGWRVAMTTLMNERGGVEAASRYVEIRADMNLLLDMCGDDPRRADVLADLDRRTELVRWQISKAVHLENDDAEFVRATSILKVLWSELWQEITTVGLRHTTPSHRDHWRVQYLESRSASIFSGTSEIQRNIISERVLGLPR
ncbi:acyl-CoA dehydrogenase family protein [Rhodococcus pyridinivorans]|uniref:acyl-CoA dehydrogenase family protein n=1 Tax=Rhodococcus pyridinivorans TaxID=103816 RepID=UPI002283B832|nr:acyl-CoA dehydrogenase family protein [Rhodococcus pyridinivorans]WAL49247.1 acyl-CoA dehydrogenase family protein [Rhodococcus pyridinivorans]